jgi:4-carboxymuconolactone decarboxylase
MSNPSSSKEKLRPVVPHLIELVDSVVFGDVWERKELSKRDRSMITIAALIAMRQTEQMRSHMEKGLTNGITAVEISEIITHLAFYAGCPAALSAAGVAKPLFEEMGFLPKDPLV